jgi:K+-transporting ATPase ATPase C chain
MWQQILPAFRMTLALTVLTGLIYPAALTGLAQLMFPRRANGSLVIVDGRKVGSEIIGQEFKSPRYFHSRPSAANYDASASGGSNLGPTSQKLADRVKASVQQFRSENPGYRGAVPADAVTTSASGFDPQISPANADAQVPRIAQIRGISQPAVRALVERHTSGRTLGVFGEPAVNVLMLNLDLDRH